MDADWGAEIESNDVVIRVNRLPADSSREREIGARCDVFFVDRCSVSDSGRIQYDPIGGGETRSCDSHDDGNCPFHAVIFRGNTQVWEPACLGETQHEAGARSAAQSSYIPWGVESDLVAEAVLALRDYDPDGSVDHKPTTGFHAAIVFSLACKSVRLYGFAGSDTVDGHAISADHGLEREHQLLRQLEAKTLPSSKMNNVLRAWWSDTDMTVVC